MSLNASGKFNLAVFGVILLAFTTEHQFQSVFGNNPIKKLSHNNFSVCQGTRSRPGVLLTPRGHPEARVFLHTVVLDMASVSRRTLLRKRVVERPFATWPLRSRKLRAYR